MQRRHNRGTAAMAVMFLLVTAATQAKGQVIPPADRVNWEGAGLYRSTPSIADTVFQINLMAGATWDAKVQAAVTGAKNWINNHPSSWVIVYFPAGTYNLSSPIILDHNYHNIILQGSGANTSVLKFRFNGTNQNCIEIRGYQQAETYKRYLGINLLKGSTVLHCQEPIGYSTPCWIRLSEENRPVDDDWAIGCVGQITRLESVSGTTGTLKDAASKDYFASLYTSICPIVPAMNIGIENLQIKREDSGSPGGGQLGINIVFDYAVNCWVKGARFEQTCKHHIQIRFSSHIYVSGCYFHDAQSFEGGGYGYGIMLTESTTNCLIENNVFHKLRHAMLVQAGANCNVFTFNYSYEQCWKWNGIYYPGDWSAPGSGPGGDICVHGNYPYANLIEHNYCERMVADAAHGDNGRLNAIVRNRVTNDHDSDYSWIYIRKASGTRSGLINST